MKRSVLIILGLLIFNLMQSQELDTLIDEALSNNPGYTKI